MSILETRSVDWPDEPACAASAASLAARPALADATIELRGPLGAGKTTFARYLLQALGVGGRIKSPTYALMEPYDLVRDGRAWVLRHFDFYRLDDPQEWEDAGFREIFAGPGLKLVEWPEKAGDLLPTPDLRVWIDPLEGELRRARFEALGERGRALLPGAAST